MNKEEFLILANAYVDSYKRDMAFYKLGKETGIFVEFENDVCAFAIEKIFDLHNTNIIPMLLDFASEDVDLFYADTRGWNDDVEISSVEDIYDYCFGV